MYCPSCDKKYGAIHSRCPECHSWLKVSAPSSSRSKAKTAAATPAASTPPSSAVSTLDRGTDEISWADPAPEASKGATQWAEEPGSSSDSWGATGTSSDSPKSASSGSGWGGAGSGSADSWSQDSASSWGGEASTPTPKAESQSGWLGGSEESGGWSQGAAAPSAPAKSQSSGWLGDSQPAAAPASKPPAGGGWLGDADSSGSLGGSPPAKSKGGSSWLGDDHQEPAEAGRGWLGDGPAQPSTTGGGDSGWLDGSQGSGRTMTEMVDHAISVEDEDEFVDDSWVDEEIRDNEFDELDVPEYVPPAPEVGGAFLKMLLVAVLFVLVAGGVLFFRGEKQTPEQLAAEKAEQQLSFARAAVAEGKSDLESGKALLAVPQFQEALVTLAEVQAPKEEINEAEVLLSRALMGSEEYEEAIVHWKSLRENEDKAVAEEAKKGVQAAARQLRIGANESLKEAKSYADKGEVNSVIRLGRQALKTYKEYGGSASQKGNAHGIIGRSYLNGRDYGTAQDHLKKAVQLAPGLGYEKYLNEVASLIQPRSYIAPVRQTQVRRSQPSSKPTFDLGSPSYQKNTRRYSGGRSRNSSSSGASTAPSAAPPKRMKEIPAYRPANRNSGGTRKGTKNVLKSY